MFTTTAGMQVFIRCTLPLLLLLGGASQTQAQDCAQPAVLKEVAAGVYVRPGQDGILFEDASLANIGFIVGQSCVAVVDTGGSPDEGKELACAIKQVTEVPVCYVLISHHHPDHMLGSLAFKNGRTRFIGHQNLANALAFTGQFYLDRLARQTGQEATPDYIIAPDQTVAIGEPLTLDLGGRMLRIQAHKKAHTNNDLSVYDEQTGTLWLADLLFVNHIPALDSSAKGWLEEMAQLTRRPAERAVPGHGPVAVNWPTAAAPLIRYISLLRKQTRSLLDAGVDLAEAQTKVGYEEKPNWTRFDDFHKRNISKVYTELEWED